jgi:hypothetical protein
MEQVASEISHRLQREFQIQDQNDCKLSSTLIADIARVFGLFQQRHRELFLCLARSHIFLSESPKLDSSAQLVTAFSSLKFRHNGLLSHLSRQLLSGIATDLPSTPLLSLVLVQLINTAWAYASVGARCEPLFNRLESIIPTLLANPASKNSSLQCPSLPIDVITSSLVMLVKHSRLGQIALLYF